MSDTVIKHAGTGKRVGAFIIDMVLSIILGVVIFLFLGEMVIMEKGNYFVNASKSYEMLSLSHLAEASKNEYRPELYSSIAYHMPEKGGKYNDINDDDSFGYQSYETDLIYFFSEFLPKSKELGYTIADYEKYSLEYFNKEWLSLKLEADEDGKYGNDFYMPGKDESSALSLSVKPTLRPEVASALENDEKKAEMAKSLLNYYFSSSSQDCLYYRALLLVIQSESYQRFVGDANNVYFLALIPTFVIPSAVFFILIPLLTKNGESVGKKMLSISLMSKSGYSAKKWQVLVHYLPFFIMGCLLMIPGYFNSVSMIILLVIAVDLMATMMHPEHQSLEDRMAKTLVVDKKASNWYLDPLQEEEANKKKEADVVEVESIDKSDNPNEAE
ncbi:MAG: RDD family protein [Bacilli bacterium]|nr:RDD family protein [Bacilli bacterium]